jgi:hypothetical protein
LTSNEFKLAHSILSQRIDSKLIDALLQEYSKARTANWTADDLKTIIFCARFSELAILCLEYCNSQNVNYSIDQIKFGKIYDKLINLPKQTGEEEMLYLVIPQTLKSIYTIRNKKQVAHYKTILVNAIDSELCMTSCNWVLSQMLLIFGNLSEREISGIVSSLMLKKLPSIQEFENGDIMVLKHNLNFKEELLLVLYHFSSRKTNKQLEVILNPKNSSYIPTYLRNLRTEKLVHCNEDGVQISQNGIAYIEKNKEKFF